mmetsp:Transcript_6650/g.18445  ORF Transcript_6650/g.18445 Transcript_6650/m.18445 type:complete len:220 (+) Transcript_6650:1399-2058(+)
MLQNRVVKVLASQKRITIGRLDFKHPPRNLQDGDIERATAEIVHRHEPLLLIGTIAQCGGRRLVDDTQHVEAGDAPRVLGRLTLMVVEVGRHRHHRLRHAPAQISLRRLLHLHERECPDLARAILLPTGLYPRIPIVRPGNLVRHHLYLFLHLLVVEHATDQTLRGVHGVRGVGHRLTLGRKPHQPLTLVGKRNHRRRRALPLGVLNHLGLLPLHDRHA